MSKPRHAHEVVASVPPDQLIGELVRHLADTIGGQVAYCVPEESDPAELHVIAAAPQDVRVRGGLPGESVRQPVRGGGLLLVAGGRERLREDELAAIRDVAGWVGVVAEVDNTSADRDQAEARARDLRTEVGVARERLAQVRDLERRRIVRAITTTTLRDLEDLRRRIGGLGELSTEDALLHRLTDLGAAVDDVLEEFRTIVRGVYPALLPEHGPRAALEELAATLPRPVRFGGELGRRTGWEVESGFYHAVAAVLNLLAGTEEEPDSSVIVEFDRDDAMHARMATKVGARSADDLRAALDRDAERIGVVGGEMDYDVIEGTAVVTVALPDRTGQPTPPAQGSAFYQRVLDLVQEGRDALGHGSDRSRWDAVEARLAKPPRLAVVSDVPVDPDEVSRASAIGVAVVVVDGPADEALAEMFLREDGPRGSIDAVLSHLPLADGFLAALRRSRQRVEVSPLANLVEVARKLVEREPVIAARRALVSVRRLMSELPEDHPLRWAVDQLAAEAHEIAELDLLDELLAGDVRLRGSVGEEAARLLGAHGIDPRTRLGLDRAADQEQVGVAAQRAVLRWRAQAGVAGGGRTAATCEVLVRTAEGLLTSARTP